MTETIETPEAGKVPEESGKQAAGPRLEALTPRWLNIERAKTSPEYQRALLRVLFVQLFYLHAAVFALVNVLLLVIDVLTGEPFWFFWALGGWGIGLAAHAGLLWGTPRVNAWLEKMVEQEYARGAH